MAPFGKSAFPLPQFTRGGQAIGYDALTELHERVEVLEAGVQLPEGEGLLDRVVTLEDKAKDLTPNLKVKVDENTEGIDVHDERLLNLSNDLAGLFNRLNQVDVVLNNINANLNNIGERVTALENRPQNG